MATLNINIASASETVEGLIEIATQAETNTGTDDLKALTPLKLEQSDLVQTDVAANTAKVTNATHTGDVTGSGVLTIDKTAISNKTLVTAVGTDHVLIGDTSDTGNLKKALVSDFLSGGTNTVAIQYFHTNANTLADGQDYFIMATTTMGATNNSTARIPIKAGTVKEVHINAYNAGTFGTSEGCTVTLETNDGAQSDVISTGVKFDARNTKEIVTGLSISVVAGLSWIKLDVPVMVTNPTGAKLYVLVYMEL